MIYLHIETLKYVFQPFYQIISKTDLRVYKYTQIKYDKRFYFLKQKWNLKVLILLIIDYFLVFELKITGFHIWIISKKLSETVIDEMK